MAHFSVDQNDRLLEELNRHEQQLNLWLDSAPANALLLLEDPVAALRAAKLGISEGMLQELQQTMEAIVWKLQGAAVRRHDAETPPNASAGGANPSFAQRKTRRRNDAGLLLE